jgi:hypothetical protein
MSWSAEADHVKFRYCASNDDLRSNTQIEELEAGPAFAPSCFDGFENGDETGIDSGGSCTDPWALSAPALAGAIIGGCCGLCILLACCLHARKLWKDQRRRQGHGDVKDSDIEMAQTINRGVIARNLGKLGRKIGRKITSRTSKTADATAAAAAAAAGKGAEKGAGKGTTTLNHSMVGLGAKALAQDGKFKQAWPIGQDVGMGDHCGVYEVVRSSNPVFFELVMFCVRF